MAHIAKVAIVGATGHVGASFARALAKTGKHSITALTRGAAKDQIPQGVKVVEVDYDREETVVEALRGQQALIITLSVRAPPDTHGKIVQAAVKAGVPWVIPNVYGLDVENERMRTEEPHTKGSWQLCQDVQRAGASSIGLICGFWYQWSLALGEPWFGFQIKERKVTFYDEGKTRIVCSTWEQCGSAIAALLSLPESGASPSLSDFKNGFVRISSFQVSQRDMLDSLHRVLGTTDKDWEIRHESAEQRYKDGLDEMKKGVRTGFVKQMYARNFFANGDGDFESARGTHNQILGLSKEDLDTATKEAVQMVEAGWTP